MPCAQKNCLDCDTGNKCTTCARGTYLEKSSTCEACSEGCEDCSDINSCNSCLSGYFSFQSRCFKCNAECN